MQQMRFVDSFDSLTLVGYICRRFVLLTFLCVFFLGCCAVNCLERFISKMTYYMSSGTLNPTHSLTVITTSVSQLRLLFIVVPVTEFMPDISMSLCAICSCCCSDKWLCIILGLVSSIFSISDGRTSITEISECSQHCYGTVAFVS